MREKIPFLSLALFVLLSFALPGKVLGDASTQLEQARTHEKNKQYNQAEQIYQQILASSPDPNDALKAQTRLTCLYIAADKQAEAEAAFAKLTADFAGHKHIANSVWEVGLKYKNAGKLDKAEEIHRHNVANFAAHKDAMWSQVEIVYSRIAQGDNGGADAAVDELLSVFSGQATLPKEIHQIANRYDKSGRDERALELRKYNVGRFPNDKYAMWSQLRIFHSLMAKGDDSGADAAVEKLLGLFSEQATLPREIHQIGGAYAKAKRRDRALELWNYNVENHLNDKFAMWSQVRTVYSHIQDGNDTAADTAAGRLLSVFSEEPTLSREIRQVAKRFGRAGMAGKAVELHTYNVDKFPKSKEAMGSQLDIVDYYLGDGNDPNGAAKVANRLVSVFSEQKGLAGKVYEIAGRLAEGGRADDAIGLYEYNVENSAEDANGLLSQVEIAYINIDKKDAAGIDAAVDKLVTAFAAREGLTKQIVRVGRRLYSGGYRDEALALHRYNIERHTTRRKRTFAGTRTYRCERSPGRNRMRALSHISIRR